MLCYEMTDSQLIKSMRVCAAVMLDCMQLKVKIIVSMHNQLICKDITAEAIKLNFRVLRLVWHTMIDVDGPRSFNTIPNYVGCTNLTVSCIEMSC